MAKQQFLLQSLVAVFKAWLEIGKDCSPASRQTPTQTCSLGFVQRSHRETYNYPELALAMRTHIFPFYHNTILSLESDHLSSQGRPQSLDGSSLSIPKVPVVPDPAPQLLRRASTSCRRTRSWSPSSPRPGRRKSAGPTLSASRGKEFKTLATI